MEEATVQGTVVATRAVPSLRGLKLVWITPHDAAGLPTDSYAIAGSVIEARCILGSPPPSLFAAPPKAAASHKPRTTGKFPRLKTGRGLKPPPLPGGKARPATKDLKPLSDEELADLLDEE